jgi:hypothetical protein
MLTHVTLNFVPGVAVRPARKSAARKLVRVRMLPALHPIMVRHIPLAPGAGTRIETLLMGITFLALAGLAAIMEAAGTSLF